MPTVAEKRRTFRALHETRLLRHAEPVGCRRRRAICSSLGFKALATTSAGAAWSLGYADGALPLDADARAHPRRMADASDLPVNADFLNGFADAPEASPTNVGLCVATGVAGLSIEDQIPGTQHALRHSTLRSNASRAARPAIDAAGGDTLLVARTECFLIGHPEPLKEAIRRLVAFAEAGADCLYAPHVARRAKISQRSSRLLRRSR